ncbi:tRNA (guanosine(37)-N1)-methyltransferase TrmD [Candidatus Deianiraea vastatrix]|uniref:tRNA (guanine-N(1)-)-methyltransferase n=1 Tax=Candidatus Deianiraea vastatrix TaxID=2163644 RepID=A0A5B8XI14_9RICK|nr:tRNA (guanosine(37)-N1)-methyltransferase TrmD [Candidatus Deianiraea vastatrix]QED23674.1 tRNA (guanine-N(1)-)-methyltransferase [Candidatus Deianiraea vastatrix]
MLVRIFTAYPEYFQNNLTVSLLKNAMETGVWSLEIVNLRDFGDGKHKKIDDTTYGGGNGLVMRPDILESAICAKIPNAQQFLSLNPSENRLLCLTSPRGIQFSQKTASQIAKLDEINIICNRFEAVDERIIDKYNIREISIGNYVLLGGEVAVCVILEASLRLLPKFLKNNETVDEESFSKALNGKLEYPQYTKPQIWNEISVPSVLLDGNHQEIAKWRAENTREPEENDDIYK